VSLKPATIEAIERMRGDKTRSKWVEEMVEHLLPIHDGLKEVKTYYIYCDQCDHRQKTKCTSTLEFDYCKNPKCVEYFGAQLPVKEGVE